MTTKTVPEYEAGDVLGKHEVTRKEELPHLRGIYYELVHRPTGARHIHIGCPDDNNAFCVIFPTLPRNSKGVAHILEHVVLAGSERFPVRDPFFSMITRSLRTFMNAITQSDGTAYPFSTRNEKDYYNLLSVYLDATLFPLITEDAFRQEGHRLEFEETGDPASGLRVKGVVFNEMKANMATPARAMIEGYKASLLPETPYAFNSGGDPEVIPDLTWEELREFHRRHYHPSNGHFYTCGNLPIERTLALIEQDALSRFEKQEVDLGLSDQTRFDDPEQHEARYPLAKEEDPRKKGQVALGWLTTRVDDTFEVIALRVLAQILLGNDAAPLRKVLIDSRLGDALADGSSFHGGYRETLFAAGLKGVEPSDGDKVEALVLETLERLVKEGIDNELVEAALHQFEIYSREVSNSGFPYSLRLFFQLASQYVHGGDPYRSLTFDDDIAKLRKEAGEGPFFEELIRKWLIDNPHRARITLLPDQHLQDERDSREQERLGKVLADLTDEKKSEIVSTGLRLKELQDAEQDLSVLPSLELTDVPMTFEEIPIKLVEEEDVVLGIDDEATNGLSYITVHLDTSVLPDGLKNRLPLFAYVLARTGAGRYDFAEMAKRIERYTGGIDAHAVTRTPAEGGGFAERLVVSGKALTRNNQPFVEIIGDILSGVSFSAKRLAELVAEYRTQKQSSVVFAGNRYAQLLAASQLSPEGLMNERLNGLFQLAQLKALAERGDDLGDVIRDLEAIRDQLFRRSAISAFLTSDTDGLSSLEGHFSKLLSALPAGMDATENPEPQIVKVNHARTTSVPVSYNAKVFACVPYTHADAPALTVLAEFLRANYTHKEIREKGGAYGGHCSYNYDNGLFNFSSYRDPHIVRTYKVYEDAVSFATAGGFDAGKVKEAVLTVCGRVDPLESPDTKGRGQFFGRLHGYTLAVREAFKGRLLAVEERDLVRVAQTHLTGKDFALATVGSADQVAAANEELGGIFEVAAI